MDLFVILAIIFFSSAFSNSKKAKQEREKRMKEQARQRENLPKEFTVNTAEAQKAKQQPKAMQRPKTMQASSQQAKPAAMNTAKKAPSTQKPVAGNEKRVPMDKKEKMMPFRGKGEQGQKKATVAQHERKPIVHSTVKQNSVQNRRQQGNDPYGGVACVHGEEAHLKSDLKPNKSSLQLEQEQHKKLVATETESFELGMSQKEIVNGIVWGEVLSRPRAYDQRRYGRR